jgi:predicted metal-dependent peptidase
MKATAGVQGQADITNQAVIERAQQLVKELGMTNLRFVSQDEFLSTLHDDNIPKQMVDMSGNVTQVSNQEVEEMLSSL